MRHSELINIRTAFYFLTVLTILFFLSTNAFANNQIIQAEESSTAYEEAMAAIRVKNYSRVVEILEPLADQGEAKAQYHLAGLYRSGRGVKRDLFVAFSLFQEAALNGMANAQYQLGVIYEKGIGIETDLGLAVFWYEQASSQGHEQAALRLEKPFNVTTQTELNPEQEKPRVFENPEEALRWAASRGFIDQVIRLIEAGVNVNANDQYGRTALIEAAAYGYPEVIRTLLESGAVVGVHDKYQINALLASVERKNVKREVVSIEDCLLCIKLLIQYGADVNTRDRYGNTPLITAAKQDKKEIVELLIRFGADIYAQNSLGHNASFYSKKNESSDVHKIFLSMGLVPTEDQETEIEKNILDPVTLKEESQKLSKTINNDWSTEMVLAWRGDLEAIKKYFEHNKVQVNKVSNSGNTALGVAVQHGHVEIAKFLFDKGANVNVSLNNGMTALHIASQQGHLNVVKVLVEEGADLNKKNEKGETPLYVSILNNFDDIGAFLLNKGASGDIADLNNIAPIHLVTTRGLTKTFDSLIENWVLVNARTQDGKTALINATKAGNKYFVKKLIVASSKVNMADAAGNSALSYAAAKGDIQLAKMLLLAGANVNHNNKNGNSALLLAAAKGHASLVDLILGAGAEINHTNTIGNSALMLAAENKHIDTMKLLLDHNASLRIKNKKDEKVFSLVADNDELSTLLQSYNKGFSRIANFF